MKPKILKIKGLYSYKNQQVIDFQHLSATGIFGIFGKVGAGKSAILDAIMLALFKRIERYEGAIDAENYMNLSANDLEIEFEFEAQNRHFKSLVKGKKSQKATVKPQITQAFYEFIDEEYIPIKVNDAAEILGEGLNFSNFTRTVIIPQNKFQTFLTLPARERAAMMTELFQLERFKLTDATSRLLRETEGKVKAIEGQVTQIGNISQQNIDNVQNKLLELDIEVSRCRRDIEMYEIAEKEQSKLKEKHDILRGVEITCIELEKNKEEFEIKEKELIEYEYCKDTFTLLLDIKDKVLEKQIKENELLNTETLNYNDFLKKYNDINNAFLAIEKAQNMRDELLEKANNFEQAAKIKILHEELLGINEKLLNIDNKLKESENHLTNFEKTINEYKNGIKNIKDKMPNIEQINAAKNWFNENKNKEENLNKERTKALVYNKNLENLLSDKNAFLEINKNIFLDNKNDFDSLYLQIELYKKEKESLLVKNEKLLRNKLAQRDFAQHAAQLTDGEPCPMCGSEHHPAPIEAHFDETELVLLEAQIIDIKNTISEAEKRSGDLRLLQQKIVAAQQQIIEQDEVIENSSEILRGYQKMWIWHYFEQSEMAIDDLLRSYKSMQKQLDDLEINIQEAEDKKHKIQIEKRNNEFIFNELNINKAAISGQLQGLQVIDKYAAAIENLSVKMLQDTAAEMQKEVAANTKKYQETKQDFEAAERQKIQLETQLKSRQERCEEYAKELASATKTLEIAISKTTLTEVEIRKILLKRIHVFEIRNQIADYKNRVHNEQMRLRDLRLETAQNPFDFEAYAALLENLKSTKERLQSLNESIGQEKENHRNLQEKLHNLTELNAELVILKDREADLKVFTSLFRANAFADYVSSIYLRNIVENANQRFAKLTNYALKLDLSEKNEFEVVDLLHDGQKRLVRTLSGGQMFQAALCLALSLSENIASSQDFFFLDEGFGSLDKESLDMVFDTLKALRKEGRIVGIISHVEEMQQEIDNYLLIKLDDKTGSEITHSYF